jgi:hypothetical protein
MWKPPTISGPTSRAVFVNSRPAQPIRGRLVYGFRNNRPRILEWGAKNQRGTNTRMWKPPTISGPTSRAVFVNSRPAQPIRGQWVYGFQGITEYSNKETSYTSRLKLRERRHCLHTFASILSSSAQNGQVFFSPVSFIKKETTNTAATGTRHISNKIASREIGNGINHPLEPYKIILLISTFFLPKLIRRHKCSPVATSPFSRAPPFRHGTFSRNQVRRSFPPPNAVNASGLPRTEL